MIELITSLAYNIVEASWHTAAVLTKIYLLTVLFRVREEFEPLKVEKLVIDESRQILGIYLTIGIISLAIGWEIRPIFPLISEGIALIYLAYLFWKY